MHIYLLSRTQSHKYAFYRGHVISSIEDAIRCVPIFCRGHNSIDMLPFEDTPYACFFLEDAIQYIFYVEDTIQ